VRLDELNEILNKLAKGEEAVKELADLDSNAGMSGRTRRNEGRDMGELRAPRESRSTPAQVTNNISINDVLSEADLSTQRMAQAHKLQMEAKALLAEAARLQDEALKFNSPVTPNGTTKSKKTAKTKEA
jgi:hypothetical protein